MQASPVQIRMNAPDENLKPSPAEIAVFRALVEAMLEEMGGALCHGAFSQNIKERRDYSCALFDSNGKLVSGAQHIPVHLGSMGTSCRAVIDALDFNHGDAAVLNDPYSGGTHLPDITCIFPYFPDGGKDPVFFLGVRAHHSDVGGIAPGSLPLSRTLSEEGIIIKPTHIVKGGEIVESLIDEIRKHSRQPYERDGDIRAQVAAGMLGIRRMSELQEKRGLERIAAESSALICHSERVLRSFLDTMKCGKGTGKAVIDKISSEPGAEIICRTVLKDEAEKILEFDFTESSGQHPGCLNANEAIVRSAVLYSLRLYLPPETPATSGLLRPVKILLRDGSILKPLEGAAVAGGNVETSQAVTEAVLASLGDIGWRKSGASQGTMNNVLLGNATFSFYETIGGGAGASDGYAGESGIQTHMTNTRNTPVESIERIYPIRIRSYSIREGSGGDGEFRGGDGVVREFEILEKMQCTILSGHRREGPPGAGGGSGKSGRNVLIRDGEEKELESRAMIELEPGDVLRIETPGGGGFGRE